MTSMTDQKEFRGPSPILTLSDGVKEMRELNNKLCSGLNEKQQNRCSKSMEFIHIVSNAVARAFRKKKQINLKYLLTKFE